MFTTSTGQHLSVSVSFLLFIAALTHSSLFLRSMHVCSYSDLQDAMVILQLYERIKVPVDWDNRVNLPPFKAVGGGHLKKVNVHTAFQIQIPV